jgi:hypothetical protein
LQEFSPMDDSWTPLGGTLNANLKLSHTFTTCFEEYHANGNLSGVS